MPTLTKGLCSICCLGYNHAAFVMKSLEAMWAQDYKNLEIVALDDGSKDNSVALLKELQARSPVPMIVIDQVNTGNIGKNFNRCLARASGEFVMFISLDDKLYPHAISEKMAFMNRDKQVAFGANSKIMGIDAYDDIKDNIAALKLRDIKNPTISDLLELEYEEFGAFYIQGAVFRSDIVRAIGGFDEDMTGDDIVLRTKFFLYMRNNPGYLFKIFDEPACYYRMHDSNVHKNTYRQIKIVASYLAKYWPERENPKILKTWMEHAIASSPIKAVSNLFCINSVTKRYLLQKNMWCFVIKNKLLFGEKLRIRTRLKSGLRAVAGLFG
jgi:glycosyltransferase involved in cell wall biosynthesis